MLAAFAAAYEALYPSDKTRLGKPRQRRVGEGAPFATSGGALAQMTDQLLFILVYQKTRALQTMHALPFGLSQPQANYWIHRLLPVLHRALAAATLQNATRAGQLPQPWPRRAPPRWPWMAQSAVANGPRTPSGSKPINNYRQLTCQCHISLPMSHSSEACHLARQPGRNTLAL